LAELSTRQIAEKDKAEGVQENKETGRKGGKLAKNKHWYYLRKVILSRPKT